MNAAPMTTRVARDERKAGMNYKCVCKVYSCRDTTPHSLFITTKYLHQPLHEWSRLAQARHLLSVKYETFLSALYFDGGVAMIYWAAVFLVIALVAGVLGFSGVAGTAVNIAWLLFVVGIVLFIIFALMGRRPPSP